jgi:hypothetical protein
VGLFKKNGEAASDIFWWCPGQDLNPTFSRTDETRYPQRQKEKGQETKR